MKRLAAWIYDNRTALSAWAGLGCLAQAVATALDAPSVVWPAAIGIGALVYSCANVAVDWLVALSARKAETK